MARHALQLSLIAASVGFACSAHAANLSGQSNAITRLSVQTGAAPQITLDKSTGAARFISIDPSGGRRAVLARGAGMASDAAKHAGSAQFLRDYADLFGIRDVAGELGSARIEKDRHGGTHLTYKQSYKGVPVFGAELKTHFDASDNLTVINGSFVPDIDVSVTPSRSADEAATAAVARAKAELAEKLSPANLARITASKPVLMIYREGLAQGVPGANRLVWQVEVGNRVDARDFYFIDAQTLKTVEKVGGIHDAKNRRAFNANNATAPGANYPNNPFWVEGQAFPTGVAEADNMIAASSDIYDLFKTAFGRDSFNGTGGTMDSIYNRGNACPNASWNGTFISFCPGLTTDDVTAHEWAHAYTEYTHGLIYAWQSGALNEAYSDIWGETVDRLNGRGGDAPDALRTPGACTVFTNATQVSITAPSGIAGVRAAGTAAFGPQTFTLAPTDVVVVNDGVGVATDGCTTPFANAAAVAGKIAFVDRGTCSFDVKAKNAQLSGAIGVIVGNNQAGAINMSASDPLLGVTIPALSVLQVDGTAIKGAAGVKAALQRGPGSDSSVRWLLGEDSTAPGLTGALRDMYNPTCYNNPGKVSDAQYSCGPNTQAGDSGGVHINSGIPNHAYALLVDGGTYNGQTIDPIGLTKAAHIYWRAQSVYQGPASDFVAHADALEQSCRDLTGATLADLKTGQPSGAVITAADCGQITKAMVAVEMRMPPAQCNFTSLLAKAPPALCPSGTPSVIASDGFDGGKKAGIKWALSHTGPASYEARDWGVMTNLPGRAGYAMFASNRDIGNCAGTDATSLQRLESADITIPAGTTTLRMAFDHWVATESGYDGGNLKISVNGGAWRLVNAGDFIYNAYNTTLTTAGNSNPLAGQAAFSGTDAGSNAGSWGRSIINLAPYAVAGDTVKLRFELGSDCGSGVVGWYVDDVQVYRCTAPAP